MKVNINDFETRYNLDSAEPDELLTAVQGGDDDQIAASRKGDADDNVDDDNAGGAGLDDDADNQDGNQDDNKGDDNNLTTPPGLSEEEFNTLSQELNETFNRFNDPEDKDAQAIRSDMLSLFKGGHSFDDEGNVLDKDGNVLASFEDVVNKVGSEPATQFNDKGDEIDAEGKVVRTKRQIEIDNNEINKVAKNLGYEFKDETGQVKLYKEGDEGLNDLAMDIATYNAEVAQQEFFDSNPVLREVAKHLLAGGDLNSFKEPVDYSKVDAKKLSFENKLGYIKQSFIADGMSPERAEKLTKGYEDNEETTKEAIEALEILEAKEVEAEEARTQAIQQQQQQEAENDRKYWENVHQTIKKGKLADLDIPEGDREAFFKYMAIPVKDGKSQEMLDREAMNEEQFLKEKYYRFKKYNVSDIVKDNVNRSRVQSIRDRIKRKEEISTGRKPNTKGRTGEVSLDTIIP